MLGFVHLKPLLLLQGTVSVHDGLVSVGLSWLSAPRLQLGFLVPKKKELSVQHSSFETCNFVQGYCHQRNTLSTK